MPVSWKRASGLVALKSPKSKMEKGAVRVWVELRIRPEGRGAGLGGIENQAGEGEGVEQVRGDGPGVADFEGVGGLVLANLVGQERLAAVPAGGGVVDVEVAGGDLVCAGVVVGLGEDLLVVGRRGLGVEELACG